VYGSPLRAFEVLCTAKYRYGENSAANPNLKKKSFSHFQSSDIGLKNAFVTVTLLCSANYLNMHEAVNHTLF
jgi:hypothetical protein